MRRLNRASAAVAVVGAMLATQSAVASADDGQCDVQCQLDLQHQNALPLTNFYRPPDPLPRAPTGTLIRKQFTTDYVVDGVATAATRILYHSRRSDGRDIAASGVVLVPSGHRPAGGWPVVVDAHGVSGIGQVCAPSLMRDLYHGNQMMRFVKQGYAVVAPDYAGLGATGAHELGNKIAAANDVIAAVPAAHAAMPGLSARWLVWGHSQGGDAALSVAERQAVAPMPGYLGAVITSPPADLKALATRAVGTPGLGAFASVLAVAAHNSDPRIDIDNLLSKTAVDRLPITAIGCLGAVATAYGDLTGSALAGPGFSTDPRFNKYLADNSFGSRRVAGPVLMLQGTADTVVLQSDTDRLVEQLRGLHSRIDYRVYPGLEHDTYPWVTGIDDGAMPDILAWTADRFAGRPL